MGFLQKHKRQDRETWRKTRKKIYERDNGKCTKCGKEVELMKCHIDHVKEISKGGSNRDENLRTLFRTCHSLRKEFTHRGMTGSALKKGWIEPGWRDKVW